MKQDATQPKPTDLSLRRARRALAEKVCPDGVIWLDAAALAHPEATRVERLPFIFLIGRLDADNGRRTVRELDLVCDTIDPRTPDAEVQLERQLISYARAIVSRAPTAHARLSGRALREWAAA